MIFFGLLVQPVDKVIENAFARDLGGIIQRYMGYRLGYDGSRGYTRWILWYTAWNITRASTSTKRESIRLSRTLAVIVCAVAAQRQLAAALGKTKFRLVAGTNRTRESQVFFFSLRPPQAAHAPRERELLARARAPCWSSD